MKPLAPKTCALPKNLPSLTSCRFFAALAVVLHHSGATGSPYEAVGKAGWMGVSFFFALSGFVLMWSFDPSRSKMDFYINRLSRIYPLHLFGLLVSLAAFFALGSPLAGYVGTELGTLASLVLVHDWIPGHREIRQAWDGVSWSLSCEFCFYLVAPFLFARWSSGDQLKRLVKLGGLWLLLIATAWTAGQMNLDGVLDFIQMHPVPHLIEFAMGAVLALIIRNNPEFMPKRIGFVFWVLPIAAYIYTFDGGNADSAIFNLLAIPGFLVLICTLAQWDITGRSSFMRHPTLVLFGEASFALYMTHALLLGIGVKALMASAASHFVDNQAASLTFSITAYALFCVCVSISIHRRIEVPARRWIIRNMAGRCGVAGTDANALTNCDAVLTGSP